MHFAHKICINGFHIILRLKGDFFLKHLLPFGLFNGQAMCFLCGRTTNFQRYSDFNWLVMGRVMAQAVSRQIPGSVPGQSM